MIRKMWADWSVLGYSVQTDCPCKCTYTASYLFSFIYIKLFLMIKLCYVYSTGPVQIFIWHFRGVCGLWNFMVSCKRAFTEAETEIHEKCHHQDEWISEGISGTILISYNVLWLHHLSYQLRNTHAASSLHILVWMIETGPPPHTHTHTCVCSSSSSSCCGCGGGGSSSSSSSRRRIFFLFSLPFNTWCTGCAKGYAKKSIHIAFTSVTCNMIIKVPVHIFTITLQQICKQTPRYTIGDCAGGHRGDNREKNRDVLIVPRKFFSSLLG